MCHFTEEARLHLLGKCELASLILLQIDTKQILKRGRFEIYISLQSFALEDALRQLFILDCLDEDGDLTPTGKLLAKLPLDPSLGRVLVAAAHSGCLESALSVCAMLSADSVFIGNRQATSFVYPIGLYRSCAPHKIPQSNHI